jgi:phosphoribosylformimino-5-aminoimidazole carboxamide ribotide isomerase
LATYSRLVMASLDVEDCKAVKLVRGRSGTGLVLGDPIAVAERLHRLGAEWLHLVDLNGARRGRPSPCVLHLLRRLSTEMGLHVQLGGGLRSLEALEEAYAAGASRLVVGSKWVRSPGFLEEASRALPGAVVAAVEEAWSGLAAVHGWAEEAPRTVISLAEEAARVRGLAGLLYTQVFHEGTMMGVDLERAARVAKAAQGLAERRLGLGLAGGVASPRDAELLRALGYSYAVVGMALHTWSMNPLGILL